MKAWVQTKIAGENKKATALSAFFSDREMCSWRGTGTVKMSMRHVADGVCPARPTIGWTGIWLFRPPLELAITEACLLWWRSTVEVSAAASFFKEREYFMPTQG